MVMKLFAAVVLLAMPIGASAQQPVAPRDQPTVVTSGEGLVQAVPGRAGMSGTAETRATNPRGGQRRNAHGVKPGPDPPAATGIPARGIKTTGHGPPPGR